MGITQLDIKLMESQRLTDFDDGGGRMTGKEVIDGNVNNLFPDISRLDRTYGRVSLRKGFVAVDTDTDDPYLGAHLVLTRPTSDPLVSVCMFSTGEPNDERTAARDRIESYVTQGPRYHGWLWGNQLQGSRALSLFQVAGTETPSVGDVLFLIENEDTASEISQYVRVTSVSSEEKNFTVDGGTVLRKTVVVEIGDPLRETFHGGEISRYDVNVFAAALYTTQVADAAKYYGVAELTQTASAGDITVQVDSIYTHLVPSAQGEAPLVDLSPGEARPVVGCGAASYALPPVYWSQSSGATFAFGRGIVPGSLVFSAYNNYTDDGGGLLLDGSNEIGTVDYATGLITVVNTPVNWTGWVNASADIATEVAETINSTMTAVTINNRGYNFTKILEPPPSPGTLVVDFMAQGKWYRLRDNGAGALLQDIDNTGTGSVNYSTGSVILTCGAIPDADSAILYAWGNPLEVENLAGEVTISVAQIVHTLTDIPIEPGSLVITWPSGGGTATATADVYGVISGDATGTVDSARGKVIFTPAAIPEPGAEFSFDYSRYVQVTASVPITMSGDTAQMTIPQAPLRAGSISFLATLSIGGVSTNLSFADDGSGNLFAPGATVDGTVSGGEFGGTTTFSNITGTVNYATGAVVLNIGNASGSELVRTAIAKVA